MKYKTAVPSSIYLEIQKIKEQIDNLYRVFKTEDDYSYETQALKKIYDMTEKTIKKITPSKTYKQKD